MTDHLTDERLEELEYNFSCALALGVEQIPIGASTVLSLVQQLRTERAALRSERAAHQATRAELEAARKLHAASHELWDAEALQEDTDPMRNIIKPRIRWIDAIEAYDAARAGEDEQ